ncbi:MAG: RagB/SusD family nutrient uptake outer membrane protein [Bacteroides sp.]|nr:RagB/SusD family nutrient uptake outer membrane protein [Bacteroides sp.]
MKNIFSKVALATVVAGAGLSVSSCSNELDLTPVNWYVDGTFWTEKSQYEGFIYAISNMFRSNYPTQILFTAGDVRAGGLYVGTLADGSGSDAADYIQNLYDASHCQFSTFGGWYGFIGNLNELIYRAEGYSEGILDDKTRDGLLAMAYGMRAFSYFQMYRMYGGLVLRLEPDVILGDYTPTNLYKARSTAQETLNQIKSDIDKSLSLFQSSGYTFQSGTKDYYWTKAATEMLAGQVYLWSGKVTTDDHAANPADVAVAKTYFANVLNNYGFALQKDFYSIWTVPHNKESIFSVCYSSLTDKTFYGLQTNFNWARTTGAATGSYWSVMDDNTYGKLDNGQANLWGYWPTDPNSPSGKVATRYSNMWQHFSLGVHRYMYKNSLFFQFDAKDSRGDAFYPVYERTAQQEAMGMNHLTDFNPNDYKMMGTFVIKFRYSEVENYQYWQARVDMPIYRLPDAILGLAECANYEGNNAEVETYINMLRQRAYGSDWNVAEYGYNAGSFKDNEVAILQESDKEFYLEGRRWWNLRRLTTVKGGSQTDHLVFQPEGCIGWGLPVASSPWMIENDGTVCETATPVLTTAWEYKLLWPIDQTLLNSDPEVKQNPGY